ncbi:sensor histidine kinase [Pleionea litopenaei]|uniref:histidine kinase n=1 Tax=Pleionea litopenaei TaxID=3070815 RepID=A0AA51X656_9GAMM|nr:ATP-binding protein [Pleionea sp. HL-JVS1]WMS86932.1 ATP-binding protein [Pleionea sp. HL-JVS1]
MSLKIKITGLLIAISLFVLGINWLGYQQDQQRAQEFERQLQTQYFNQVANASGMYFERFKQSNQALLDTSFFTGQLSEKASQSLVNTLNQFTSAATEFLIYDIDSKQIYLYGEQVSAGEFLGLESVILSQMKSPGNKIQVTKFKNEYAVVFSNTILVEQNPHSVIFNILKLNQQFIDELKNLSGADFQLSLNGVKLQTATNLNMTGSRQIPWPIATKTQADLQVVFPTWLTDASKSSVSMIHLSSIAILLFIGIVLSFLFLNRQQNKLEKFAEVATSHSSPKQLINALSETVPPAELMDLRSSLIELLNQLQSSNKKLQLQMKSSEQQLKEVKQEKVMLQTERDSAVSAPKTKSEFLSRMGDEITTPMKTLTSMLHLLSEYNLSEEPKELLNISRRSANTLINNLNNILDFSKLDANLLKLHKNDFEVRQLVDEVVAEYTPHAKSKSLILTHSISPDVPQTAFNDARRIKQIVKNLLGNAIRFTKDGEVSLYCDVVMESNSEYLRFTIQDSGVGIPEDALRGLFDSLEQKTKLTNSSFAGRLRLIVSKKLSELMGGSIGVSSELQKGSRFWFTVSMHKN